jgi:hypothetical protein
LVAQPPTRTRFKCQPASSFASPKTRVANHRQSPAAPVSRGRDHSASACSFVDGVARARPIVRLGRHPGVFGTLARSASPRFSPAVAR